MNNLKKRWNINSNWQFALIFIIFAITGSTSAVLAKPLANLIGLTKENVGLLYIPFRILLIFPIYQILLVFIGYLFGQFTFFWAFEKKMLHRLKLGFIANFFDKKSNQ
jgi:hypothetical protein